MSETIDGLACGTDSCATGLAQIPAKSKLEICRTLQVDIVSDAICPWCYVAKRQFEMALPTLRENFDVSVHWYPFQLNPAMPKEGLDRKAYRSAKFGSWEHSQQLDAQVANAGAQVGLNFHHERMERTPNTVDAHRLIWLAGQRGVQDAVVEGLFFGYFIDGRDVGNRAVLADIAQQAGLPKADVVEFLDSDEGLDAVLRAEAVAQQGGLSGVPTFIVNGKAMFSGALRSELMIERILAAFHAVAAESPTQPRLAS
jgi:predicted DsbA family dithiol-disulfide isomerase